jgi:hypothetical protein
LSTLLGTPLRCCSWPVFKIANCDLKDASS